LKAHRVNQQRHTFIADGDIIFTTFFIKAEAVLKP